MRAESSKSHERLDTEALGGGVMVINDRSALLHRGSEPEFVLGDRSKWWRGEGKAAQQLTMRTFL